MQERLRRAFGTVDDIDLWVGGVSEDPLAREGSQLGETFREIVILQFTALRDHDRFWWERDLTRAEQLMVKKTTLGDVILRNTSIKRREIPKNVFYVDERRPGGGGWPQWRW